MPASGLREIDVKTVLYLSRSVELDVARYPSQPQRTWICDETNFMTDLPSCFHSRHPIDINLRECTPTRHMFVTYLQVDFQATIMDARRDRRPKGALRDIKITYEGLARVDGSARFSSGKDGFCVSFA